MKKKNLNSSKETGSFASDIAKELMSKTKKTSATVLGLTGDLGVGKTTFTQAFAKTMGVKRRVLSPTFLIMRRFSLTGNNNFENLYHIDAYRVGKKDLKELGFKEILKKPNLVLIEWADKVEDILPKDTLWLRFKHGNENNERQVTINRH